MPLASLTTCRLCCSTMVERTIEETLSSPSCFSTRTSSTYCRYSSLDFTQFSVGSRFMIPCCSKVSVSYSPVSHASGTELRMRKSIRKTQLESRFYTGLDLKEHSITCGFCASSLSRELSTHIYSLWFAFTVWMGNPYLIMERMVASGLRPQSCTQ